MEARGDAWSTARSASWSARTMSRKYFPPASKAKMVELVGNLKAAMAERIKANSWMSAATKTAAVEKLGKMDVMVGYPGQVPRL